MKKKKIVQLRRRREGKTHYKKRLKILMSKHPRLVIRKSVKNIQANIVEYNSKGDHVIISVHSNELKKLGWKLNRGNLPSAYLVGLLLGKRAKNKGIKSAVLDIGLNKSVKGSRFYAALSGALDAGLQVPHNPKVLPAKERISAKHVSKYAVKLKNDENALKKQFSNYIKNDIDLEKLDDHFNSIKKKIEAEDNGKKNEQ